MEVVQIRSLCRKHGMSEGTFYAWKSKYGGMTVSDAKRLKALEDENAKLKKLSEQMLDAAAMKELLSKSGEARTKSVTVRICRLSWACYRACSIVSADRTMIRYQSVQPRGGIANVCAIWRMNGGVLD